MQCTPPILPCYPSLTFPYILWNQELEIFKNVATELFFLFNIQVAQNSSYIRVFCGRPLFCKIPRKCAESQATKLPTTWSGPVSHLEISHEISSLMLSSCSVWKKGCNIRHWRTRYLSTIQVGAVRSGRFMTVMHMKLRIFVIEKTHSKIQTIYFWIS